MGLVYLEITGKNCTITLEPRPVYCDRGRYIAKVHVTNHHALWLDDADCWPRYYFDLERAKAEVIDFLKFRQQWIDDTWTTHKWG